MARDPNEVQPTYEFLRFDRQRHAKKHEAALVLVNGWSRLWMNRRDLKMNIAEHGNVPGLMQALAAYDEHDKPGGE